MRNNLFLRSTIVLLMLLSAVLFTGCDWGGDNGTLSNSVYLKGTDGTKVYSGGVINLGTMMQGSPSYTVTFNLVNGLGEEVTLSETPDFVSFMFEAVSLPYTALDYTEDSTAAYSYISLDQSALAGTLSAGSESGDIIFTVSSAPDNYQIRRRYTVVLSDSSGFYDFEFEVFGYFSS